MRGFLVHLATASGPPDPRPDVAAWAGDGVRIEAGDGAVLARRGPLVAAAALRLDNRDDLQSALALPPEAADADLLLAAVEAWGADAVGRLDGPFAVVVWDTRTREALVGRDGLGLRPLFQARLGGDLAFGTDLATVRARTDGRLRPEAVADHLAGALGRSGATLTANVERVPAGHVLTVREGTVDRRPFWPPPAAPPLALPSDGAYAEAFREVFDRAVACRLGGAPAAFLSGGLDSSSIVVTARALRPEPPLPTLSLVYDDPAADERQFVDAVVEGGGLAPHRLDGASLSLLGGLDGDLGAVGEPFPTPNLFLARSLHAEAARLGADVVLDGFAGDSVVGHGDLLMTEWARGLRWGRFLREARAVAGRSRRPRRMLLQIVRDYALPSRPEPVRSFAHADLPAPAAEPRPARTDRDAHRAEVTGPLFPRAFEAAYAVATAHGIEPRYPFADRRLVEWCLALPSEQRLRDGLTRSVLRRAMAGRLPDALRARSGKARLGGMFHDALFDREPDVLRRIVHEDVPAAADLLDVPAVQAAVAQASAHPEARTDLAPPIWRALALARWLALRAA